MYNNNSHSYQYYDQNVCNNYEQDYASNYNYKCQANGNYYALNSNLSGNASYDSSSSSSSFRIGVWMSVGDDAPCAVTFALAWPSVSGAGREVRVHHAEERAGHLHHASDQFCGGPTKRMRWPFQLVFVHLHHVFDVVDEQSHGSVVASQNQVDGFSIGVALGQPESLAEIEGSHDLPA